MEHLMARIRAMQEEVISHHEMMMEPGEKR
jgi:hypothetical protein